VAYAHSRGMRVSGHIPAGLRAQALDAGYDEIQHINQVLLNFLVKPDTETRNLNRFVLPAEKVADLDFNSKPVKDFVPAGQEADLDRSDHGHLRLPQAARRRHERALRRWRRTCRRTWRAASRSAP
jgi:hypothetical protein